MLRSLLTIVAAMMPVALATITKRALSDVTLMQNDSYVFYMNEVFDVSKVKGVPSFTTSLGDLRTFNSPIAQRNLDGGYAKVEVIEYIDNSTFGIVLDNSHAVIQSVDLEGNRFTQNVDFSYFRFGANVRCDDLELYKPTGRVYVACWDIEPLSEEPGQLFLIELDMADTTNYRVINVNQTEDVRVQHRIRMGIWTLPQGATEDTYLILYDQGISSTDVFNNKWMHVFDRIRVGAAGYVGVVDIQQGFPNARALYDIFYFNNQLLLTTSIQGEVFLSMTSCDFFIRNMSVYCNENTRKISNISFGYIGMTVNQNWVQFDLNSNQFVTCDVSSNFSKPDWRSQNCEVFTDIPRIDDCFVRIVEDNFDAKVIIWVHPNGEYAGISVHSRALGRSWKEVDTTAVLINKYLYVAEPTKISIRRLEYDSVYVKASVLANSENPITFQAKDDESSGIVNTALIFQMKQATDNVGFSDDHYLPEIDVYGGNTFYMPLNEDDLVGNNLTFVPSFADSVVNYTTSRVYNTFRVNVIYTFKKSGLPEFSEITFTPNFAVGKDLQNRIFFFKCGTTELDQIRCDEEISFSAKSNQQLQKYSREMLSYVLVWTKDPIKTTVYMWDTNSGELYSNEYAGQADDVHGLVYEGRGWIFVAYASKGEVQVSSWSPVNPSNFNVEAPLNVSNAQMPHFCPTDVFDTFNGTYGYLEILSVCYNIPQHDQRIFRYNIHDLSVIGSHPITLDLVNPQICAVKDAYIIASIEKGLVYGKRLIYDESHFEFYLDKFADYTKLLGMNCVSQSDMLTIYFEDKFNKLGFFTLWGNTLTRANKRIHTTVTDMSTGTLSIQSFSINGDLLHTLYDTEGSMNYYMSLSKAPKIRIDVAAISETANTTSGRMTLSLTNGGTGGSSVQATLNIRRMETGISFKTNGNTAEFGDEFALEDYLSLKGHIFNATLRDTRTTKSPSNQVRLIQRAELMDKFVPSEVEQVIYQHIEAHGDYTVALHMDKSFASFFTIFTNVSTHRGVIQPRDSVQAFDFSPLSAGRALIAYSTAPVSGSKLRFLLVNGADKIGEASVNGSEYSKIRLLPVDERDNVILFALNPATMVVDVYFCNVTAQAAQIYRIRSIEGVSDFDITNPGSFLNMYYVADEGTVLKYITWKKTDITGREVASGTLDVQDTHKFWFMTVDCIADGEKQSTCIINTLGTIIFEVILENGQDIPEKVYTLNKFGNFDGKYIYLDSHFIAMRAVTATAPRQYAFLIWKRAHQGGDGLLYYGINIDGAARPGTDIYSGFTPYTLLNAPNGDHVLIAGTHNEFEPLQFYKVDKFRVKSNVSSGDLAAIYLDVEGYSGVQAEVGALSQFSTEEKKNLKWWVPTLIVFVLLVGAAVTYFVCVNNNKTDSGDREPNYRSGGEEENGQQLLIPKENKQDA